MENDVNTQIGTWRKLSRADGLTGSLALLDCVVQRGPDLVLPPGGVGAGVGATQGAHGTKRLA